jgi:hypothetical protein
MAPHLLGAPNGFRERLAEAGVTILADNTSFSVGNTNGGFAQAFDYAGHGDYCVIADGGKLGVHEGLYLKLRAEHRYGETIVGNVGCFISPTLIADLPVYNSEQVYLTNVLLTQELTDAFSVFAGKMDTLDGDMNAFAHGRGKTQFSNMGFIFNPIVGATVPYSTLGAGFVLHPEDGPIRVIPYMRIDGKRVVPRLEFTINLVAALPSAVAGPLRQAAAAEEEPPVMLKRPLVVNAFTEPQLVKHARVIVERRLAGKTYKEIAKDLDLTKDHMRNCARIARLMEDAGIPEPYHRPTEKPDRVSQWCSKHWLKAGDRKGGGKRRRAS